MYKYNAKVLRVIDGDTIEVSIDLGFHLNIIERLRFSDIDAPEIKGDSRERGLQSKKFVEEWCKINSNILIKTEKGDAFGRWISHIYDIS